MDTDIPLTNMIVNTTSDWMVSTSSVTSNFSDVILTTAGADVVTFDENLAKSLETYLTPFLLVLGMASNVISFTVLDSPPLRTIVNTWYYRTLVWTDFVLLQFLAWPIMIKSYTGTDFLEMSVWSCRIWSYATHVSYDFSHWILSICTLERLLGISFPTKMMVCWLKKQAWISMWIIAATSLVVNIPALVLYDVVPESTATLVADTRCFVSQQHASYGSWMYFEFTVNIIIPFVFVMCCNVALILTLQLSQVAIESNALPMPLLTSMSKVLFGIISTSFLLTTPLFVYNLVLYFVPLPADVVSLEYMRLGYTVCYLLAIVSRGVKFLTYRFICPRFRGQFLVMYHGHQTEKEKNSSFSSSVRTTTVPIKRDSCDGSVPGTKDNKV